MEGLLTYLYPERKGKRHGIYFSFQVKGAISRCGLSAKKHFENGADNFYIYARLLRNSNVIKAKTVCRVRSTY